MNQKIILSGVLTLALISSGCTAQTSSQAKAGTSAPKASATSTESATATSNTNSTTAETTTGTTAGKETKGSAIGKYGKVKKIIGNSVTIELAELPKRAERTGKAAADKTTAGSRATTGTEAAKEGGPPPSGEPSTGGGAPPSGSGERGGAGASVSGGGAKGGSSGMKGSFGLNTEDIDLTGEVLELMIPVGVKITSNGTSGMKEIDFADIIQGDIIALYYVEGTQTIERVVITPSSTN